MKTLILAAALAFSGAAFANDVDPNGFEKQHFQASATRAEVVADLKAAQAQGQLPQGELGVKPQVIVSKKSRAEVAADARNVSHRYGEVAEIE